MASARDEMIQRLLAVQVRANADLANVGIVSKMAGYMETGDEGVRDNFVSALSGQAAMWLAGKIALLRSAEEGVMELLEDLVDATNPSQWAEKTAEEKAAIIERAREFISDSMKNIDSQEIIDLSHSLLNDSLYPLGEAIKDAEKLNKTSPDESLGESIADAKEVFRNVQSKFIEQTHAAAQFKLDHGKAGEDAVRSEYTRARKGISEAYGAPSYDLPEKEQGLLGMIAGAFSVVFAAISSFISMIFGGGSSPQQVSSMSIAAKDLPQRAPTIEPTIDPIGSPHQSRADGMLTALDNAASVATSVATSVASVEETAGIGSGEGVHHAHDVREHGDDSVVGR